ncbi:MAG: hypothetical protein ACPL7B_01655 [Candidatus Poribacteria bacterium]
MEKDLGIDAIVEPNSLQQIVKDLKFTKGSRTTSRRLSIIRRYSRRYYI